MAEQKAQHPIAYQTNKDGVYVGTVKRQASPLEPGVFLIPGGAVLVAPPEIPAGQQAHWDGSAWSLQPIPPPPAQPEPMLASIPELKVEIPVDKKAKKQKD
jgi:hypothetical protein